MLQKSIRKGICHSIYQHPKVNSNKGSPYLQYCDVINFYGWKMSQQFPVNNFKWIEDPSQFVKL